MQEEDEVYPEYFRVKEYVDISDVAAVGKWNALCGEGGVLGATLLVRLKKKKSRLAFSE